jgi:hypothetical protein
LAISFFNEKRETIFIASKWSTHGYIKTGRSACHWTSIVHLWAQIKVAFSLAQEVTAVLQAYVHDYRLAQSSAGNCFTRNHKHIRQKVFSFQTKI